MLIMCSQQPGKLWLLHKTFLPPLGRVALNKNDSCGRNWRKSPCYRQGDFCLCFPLIVKLVLLNDLGDDLHILRINFHELETCIVEVGCNLFGLAPNTARLEIQVAF